MIKTLQQFNQKFLSDYISNAKDTEVLIESDTPDVPDEEQLEAEDKKVQETRTSKAKLNNTSRWMPLWKDLLFLLLKILSIILIFVSLFTFLFGILRYSDPSMDPAIKDGDLVIFYRYTKSGYQPQDVIALEIDGKMQVRRVGAGGGDTVDITEQGLMVNGALQQEPGIFQNTELYVDGIDFPLVVPLGYVFVLGDARLQAKDSRIYGCVKIKDTSGKVMAVIRRRSI